MAIHNPDPCPICGNKVSVYLLGRVNWRRKIVAPFRVECQVRQDHGCGLRTADFPTEFRAVQAWNYRPALAPLTDAGDGGEKG